MIVVVAACVSVALAANVAQVCMFVCDELWFAERGRDLMFCVFDLESMWKYVACLAWGEQVFLPCGHTTTQLVSAHDG